MSEARVERAVGQFVTAASLACAAGFGGVEIHAAHGYLVSQLLSSLTDLRQDTWGGSLDEERTLSLSSFKLLRTSSTLAAVRRLNTLGYAQLESGAYA